MLDSCILAFSHAEIIQLPEEILVLKDIFNLVPKDLSSGSKQIVMTQKSDLVAEI